ncbi:DNA repair protein RecO [uncultured Lactobacillus sp.]|uniref:DNA repair protein RecO n=1 Tax=uncultured Lactobacillus sp. TaxID=153152 RepID=UPI002631A4F9|nr:DNA repair protein RecO [uncultured Lactobacillus sp.]
MASELVDVSGIIFKRKRYKEADVLTKIITKQKGIFTIDVKGALRPKSKLGAATLNFSYGIYTVNTSNKGISSLRTFKNVRQFENIYLDITKQAYASYILDLVDHAFIEYQANWEVYDLVFTALNKINDDFDEEIIKQMIELKMLYYFGVAPKLDSCMICNKKQGIFDFSLERGAIICSDHFNQVSDRMHLDPQVVSLIRTLALIKIDRLGKININTNLKNNSKRVIDRMYTRYLDLNLKSKKFLDELRMI